MVQVTYVAEIQFPIPKERFFEVLVEAKGFLPHAVPPTVRYANFQETLSTEGGLHMTVRHTVDAGYQAPFLYQHSTVERDELHDTSRDISHEVKTKDDGLTYTYTGKYVTVGQVDITGEQMRAVLKENADTMFRAIQAYKEKMTAAFEENVDKIFRAIQT